MSRFLSALVVVGVVGAASQSPAACRWFGTQLECALGGSQVSIGTQTAHEPAYAGTFQPERLHGRGVLFDGLALPTWPLRLEIQNIGSDAGLCRKLGNETYCY